MASPFDFLVGATRVMVLLRSLYDHIVTFAWLAADPPTRLALWRKEDLEERLKIHREFAAAGEQLLPDADREQMEHDVARLQGKAPDLASKVNWLQVPPTLSGAP